MVIVMVMVDRLKKRCNLAELENSMKLASIGGIGGSISALEISLPEAVTSDNSEITIEYNVH